MFHDRFTEGEQRAKNSYDTLGSKKWLISEIHNSIFFWKIFV